MSTSLPYTVFATRRLVGRETRIHHRLLSHQVIQHPRSIYIRQHAYKLPPSLQATQRQTRFKSEITPSRITQEPTIDTSKKYSFSEMSNFAISPSPSRILIDVREPSEIRSTGHIPGAKNIPMTSAPDGLFLPAEDFEEKFGWSKPKSDDELVFYCKAGVRSRAAAGMARMAGWKKIAEYPGSWLDWVEQGGKIERN